MKWNRPSKEQVNTAIDQAGGTMKVSRLLFKSRDTVRKWRNGTNKIDFANWEYLKGVNDERD
jgi:hypothetical protein